MKNIADNVSVLKSAHLFTFGGEFTQINSWQQIASTDTMPTITFAAATGDPILNTFAAANLPLVQHHQSDGCGHPVLDSHRPRLLHLQAVGFGREDQDVQRDSADRP